MIDVIRLMFFVVVGSLGYATVNAQIAAGTTQKLHARRQISTTMRLLPQVIYICLMVILLRVLKIGAHGALWSVIVDLQLVILVSANMLIAPLWGFLAVQTIGILVFATTTVFSPTVFGVYLLACLIVYGTHWHGDAYRRISRFVAPLIAGAMFWGVLYWRIASLGGWQTLLNYVAFVWGYLALLDFDQYQQQDQRVVARLTREVQYDALTQVRNWATFQTDLDHIFAQRNASLMLVVLDIDHFKAINDNHGHLAGNQALVAFASALHAYLQKEAPAARFYRTGGEEFAVILPGLSQAEATLVMTGAQALVRHLTIETTTGALTLTSSFGMSAKTSADPNATALFKRADHYLYESKRAGRDRLTVEGKRY